MLALLRRSGIADIQTNVMSLAGHRDLDRRAGRLVDRDGRERACTGCGSISATARCGATSARSCCRPAGRSAGRSSSRWSIMLLSFLPVFALGGIEGKMFRPLAYTKSFALAAVAVLAVTLVPALCTVVHPGTDARRRRRAGWSGA